MVLTGCQQKNVPAVYQAQVYNYWHRTVGYSDQKVGENEHSIVAVGYKSTTKENTAQLALLRAARLTLEQGRQRFVIVHGTSTRQRIGTVHTIAISGSAIPIVVALGSSDEPTAILIIRLMNDDEAPSDAYDAKAIEAAIAPVFK